MRACPDTERVNTYCGRCLLDALLRLGQFGLDPAASLSQVLHLRFRRGDDLLRERCEQRLKPLVSVDPNRFDDDFVKSSIAAGIDVGTAWIDANLGRRGFLSALDAQTGVEVWRWYTTKEDGWEGDYAAATPDGMPLHRDIAAEKAAAQLYKNAWAAGSNSTWMTPAFDPAAGLIFVGTGNPAPGDVDLVRAFVACRQQVLAEPDLSLAVTGLRWLHAFV